MRSKKRKDVLDCWVWLCRGSLSSLEQYLSVGLRLQEGKLAPR